MSDQNNNQRDMVILFGLGLMVGAAAGILLAPGSGEETRKRIGAFVDDSAGKAREGIQSAGGVVREQTHRIGHALKEGKEAFEEGLRKG